MWIAHISFGAWTWLKCDHTSRADACCRTGSIRVTALVERLLHQCLRQPPVFAEELGETHRPHKMGVQQHCSRQNADR